MGNANETPNERQLRLEFMLSEFRAAQQRRAVKRDITTWNERVAQEIAVVPPPVSVPEKIH